MAKNAKKKDDEAQEPATLQQKMLDRREDKYGVVPLAAIYAKHLRRSQEFHNVPMAEILDRALEHVLGGEVTWDQAKDLLGKLKEPTPADAGEAGKANGKTEAEAKAKE